MKCFSHLIKEKSPAIGFSISDCVINTIAIFAFYSEGFESQFSQFFERYFSIVDTFHLMKTVNNVSSTNSEQSKLCINGPLHIDARLLWKQAISSNSP